MSPSRIDELRRRVQSDPASIAFAQLAEEYRRSGQTDEAVRVCREGLTRHPGYLSARVTLGRALLDLGQLGDAQGELEFVVAEAPENLAAVRGLAEIFQRGGNFPEALTYYRRALTLARHDPEIEEIVQQLSRQVGVAAAGASEGLSFEEAHRELLSAAERVPVAPPTPPRLAETTTAPAAVGATAPFDFDRLVAALGTPVAPAQVEAAVHGQPMVTPADLPQAPEDPSNPFAALEAELRAQEPPAADASGQGPVPPMPDLSAWQSTSHEVAPPLMPIELPAPAAHADAPLVELHAALDAAEPAGVAAANRLAPDWSGLLDVPAPADMLTQPGVSDLSSVESGPATSSTPEDVLGDLETWLDTLHDRSNP